MINPDSIFNNLNTCKHIKNVASQGFYAQRPPRLHFVPGGQSPGVMQGPQAPLGWQTGLSKGQGCWAPHTKQPPFEQKGVEVGHWESLVHGLHCPLLLQIGTLLGQVCWESHI